MLRSEETLRKRNWERACIRVRKRCTANGTRYVRFYFQRDCKTMLAHIRYARARARARVSPTLATAGGRKRREGKEREAAIDRRRPDCRLVRKPLASIEGRFAIAFSQARDISRAKDASPTSVRRGEKKRKDKEDRVISTTTNANGTSEPRSGSS